MKKVDKLSAEGKTKHYKKYLYSKLFKEDENKMPKYKRQERATLLAKLKKFEPEQEEGQDYSFDWIKKIDDGNISDLKPEEIPDD